MIAKFTLLIALTSAGCFRPSNVASDNSGPETKPVIAMPAPVSTSLADINRVRLDGFSLYIPASMRKVPAQTTVSTEWVFRDDEMTIAFESGMNAPNLENFGELDFREFPGIIDGESCKIVSFEFRDTSGRVESSKKYSVSVRFEQSDRTGNPLNVYVYFRSAKNRPIATQILESIKFNEK